VATQSKRTIDSLNRGIDLLEILAERGNVRLAELSDLLGSSRATVFRVLKTLQERGYVEHVRSEHTYRLGPGSVILAARSQTSAVIHSAGPAMADLRDTTEETVNLALLRGGRLVYVEILEGSHAIRMSGNVGEEAPLHSTALGKATLAALPPEKGRLLLGEEPYPSYTSQTHTTWKQLAGELGATRDRGYAVDLEEMDFGASCVAAAIVGEGDHPVGALSVAGLAARLTPTKHEEIGERVANWARRVSSELGHVASPVSVKTQ
jgi:DNA-binding IclR family transcriptional regulator